MTTFDRDAVRAFRFVRCTFDAGTGIAQLVYAFDDGAELVETVTVPGAPFALDAARAAAAEQALRLLHLIAGVSYYKAAVPGEIRIDSYEIDADTAGLLEELYLHGLGEFAYRNGLDLHGRIRFPVGGAPPSSAPAGHLLPRAGEGQGAGAFIVPEISTTALFPRAAEGRGADAFVAPEISTTALLPHAGEGAQRADEGASAIGLAPHALVAIGGGKDSLVSIEALRSLDVAQTVTWIGGSQLIRACAERTGLPTLNIGRQIAPQLFDYNRQGAWNGHIPVTAINSAIMAFAAVVLGMDQVVFSNERSASYGSLIVGADGVTTTEVNHQWSKGWAFERAFGAHLQRRVAADLQYYSLLRPLSELAVARQFAKTDRYDAHFSSCNRNFHLLGERPTSRWCGVCPKCHFVFLALGVFMPKPRLVSIFGRNLLDDASQVAGFDALLEFQDHKPFECVGEGRESRAAMAALGERPEWREDAIVARFVREILPQLDASELAIGPLMDIDGQHRVLAALWERLRAQFAA